MTEPKDEAGAIAGEGPAEPLPVVVAAYTPPRVWTVFVAYVAALSATVGFQILVAIVLAVWYLAKGVVPQKLTEELTQTLTNPAAFIPLILASQLAIMLAALLPARLSPQPTLARLGLVRPALPVWGYGVVVLGTILPFALGLFFAIALAWVIDPDPSVQAIYEQMTPAMAGPFILIIALVPGFVEELFFRGYMQRRLLERWSPWAAILVTSILFALMHITPHAVAFAFPLGLWLGVLSWRTGAVWPGMLCHAFINGSWNIFQIGHRFDLWSDSLPTVETIAGGAVVLVCFLASVWLLARQRAVL